ncbi:hypothetical protein J7T55_014059 [Diaporthe amygdali]|uniref:uncharacterized protein n=1 Tax=Phomopsis amygdali TaxID=1214568 RepID=UPI0022FF1328|nr:uncharacterized protein J7T55_014059 [Diaporthe amygdali]KAJ0119853.1 hypothetical protein J7T55_014059 [Diaporthe amygdali]
MSAYKLTPAQEALDYDTRQPALWASLVAFVIINNLAIFARTWIKWVTKLNGKRITAEDIFHVWITMVLMASFFLCIKMTLLFFYKRLFLVTILGKTMRVFWWVNLVYVILWWIGATGFYLFQCSPVQWYFIQYYARFGKPVPGGVKGQCKATKVLNVALPVVFSLVSDVGLMVLPIWAISRLKVSKKRKYGLLAVFGLGAIACMLELGRILDLLLDTDDKTDPSWGVAIFLILTAAIETAAVVCACLPVIGPQLIKGYKKLAGTRSDYPSYGNSSGLSADNKLVLLQNRRSKSTQGNSNNDQIGLKGSFRGEDGIQLADFVARDENSYDEGDASNGPHWRSHAFVEDTRTWPVLPPPALGRVLVQADVEIESGPGSGVRLHSHLHKSNNHAFATTARF